MMVKLPCRFSTFFVESIGFDCWCLKGTETSYLLPDILIICQNDIACRIRRNNTFNNVPHQGVSVAKGHHDTLVYRLSQMLVKLNQGEYLDPKSLSDEFGVNLRTVQRDLTERFAFIPLLMYEGWYARGTTFCG